MRVLFASAHKYLPELHGGMEVNTHQLVARLSRVGLSVGILAGLMGRGITGVRAKVQMGLFGRSVCVDKALGYSVWRAQDSSTVAADVAELFQPDIVVVQGGLKFLTLVHCFRRLGLPVIGYLHSADRLPLDDALQVDQRLSFIANSRFTASLHPEKRIVAILPPIVPRELYATETDRSSAIFVNPVPYKGLSIVMSMAEARPDVPFLFVSNGSARSGAHRTTANITRLGPIRDMRKVYRRARIVLVPSQCDETWGRTVSEAHISGIPVLASARGGLPESVGSGGVCLPNGAPASTWVSKFSEIWDSQRDYQNLSKAALEFSLRRELNPKGVVKELIGILEDHAQA